MSNSRRNVDQACKEILDYTGTIENLLTRSLTDNDKKRYVYIKPGTVDIVTFESLSQREKDKIKPTQVSNLRRILLRKKTKVIVERGDTAQDSTKIVENPNDHTNTEEVNETTLDSRKRAYTRNHKLVVVLAGTHDIQKNMEPEDLESLPPDERKKYEVTKRQKAYYKKHYYNKKEKNQHRVTENMTSNQQPAPINNQNSVTNSQPPMQGFNRNNSNRNNNVGFFSPQTRPMQQQWNNNSANNVTPNQQPAQIHNQNSNVVSYQSPEDKDRWMRRQGALGLIKHIHEHIGKPFDIHEIQPALNQLEINMTTEDLSSLLVSFDLQLNFSRTGPTVTNKAKTLMYYNGTDIFPDGLKNIFPDGLKMYRQDVPQQNPAVQSYNNQNNTPNQQSAKRTRDNDQHSERVTKRPKIVVPEPVRVAPEPVRVQTIFAPETGQVRTIFIPEPVRAVPHNSTTNLLNQEPSSAIIPRPQSAPKKTA